MKKSDETIVFIPVRGGSKSIAHKNIKAMNGKPLVYWAIKAASDSKNVDKIFVCTEDEEIKQVVECFISAENMEKVSVVGRSQKSARDEASTEEVMLEFAVNYNFETIILIQATSPLISTEDIDRAIDIYQNDDTDSVLSAVKQKRFIWNGGECEDAKAENYDIFHRPRRQEMDGYWVENGAIYITSKERLLKYKNRISGRIKIVPMREETYFEIDDVSDWIIVEELMKREKK